MYHGVYMYTDIPACVYFCASIFGYTPTTYIHMHACSMYTCSVHIYACFLLLISQSHLGLLAADVPFVSVYVCVYVCMFHSSVPVVYYISF